MCSGWIWKYVNVAWYYFFLQIFNLIKTQNKFSGTSPAWFSFSWKEIPKSSKKRAPWLVRTVPEMTFVNSVTSQQSQWGIPLHFARSFWQGTAKIWAKFWKDWGVFSVSWDGGGVWSGVEWGDGGYFWRRLHRSRRKCGGKFSGTGLPLPKFISSGLCHSWLTFPI